MTNISRSSNTVSGSVVETYTAVDDQQEDSAKLKNKEQQPAKNEGGLYDETS